MTPEGKARLRAKAARARAWRRLRDAHPDVPSTQHFRHMRAIERRRRPTAPSFAGTPLPKHRSGEESGSATIVMAYCHPWTLRAENSEEHVSFAGQLRNSDETWQYALCRWLDGRKLCDEARWYVGNFLAVHRVRHQTKAPTLATATTSSVMRS